MHNSLADFDFMLVVFWQRDHSFKKIFEKKRNCTAKQGMARRFEKQTCKTEEIEKKLCLSQSADVELNASGEEESSEVLFSAT